MYPIVFLLATLYACDAAPESRKLDVNIQTPKHQTNSKDPIMSVEKLMSLSKSEAVSEFGAPSFEEKFILDDAQGEFRNNITDAFSAKERQSESILIEEVTWEKDEETWITVWYHLGSDKQTPKSYLEWNKGAEF